MPSSITQSSDATILRLPKRIQDSKSDCEALTGATVTGFAYPYGDSDDKAREASENLNRLQPSNQPEMDRTTIETHGIKDRLRKGAGWLTATRVLVNLIAFANTLLLARLLVPDDFGLVAIATTFTAIITSITELSLASALVQHKELHEDHFDGAWTLNLLRGAILALLIWVLAIPIARLYGDPRLAPILLVIGATTLLGGVANPKLAIFTKELIFRQEFVIAVSQKVTGLAVMVLVALIFRSYWALVAGTVAAQVSATVLSYSLIPYKPRLRLRRVAELLSFSFWITLGQTVNTLNWKFDQLLVGYFLGNTSLGYYMVGNNLAALPTRESTAPLDQTLFPAFVLLTHDLARLRSAYQRAQSLLCAVALPLGFGFAIISEPLVRLTLGARWLAVVIVIQMLAGNFALQTLSSTAEPLALAMGKTQGLFKRDLLNFGLRLPLIVIGMIAGGLVGIVCARCIFGAAAVAINMEMVRRLLGLSFRDQVAVNLRTLISVGTMTVAVFFIGRTVGNVDDQLYLAAKIACMVTSGAVIYMATLFLLWHGAGRPAGFESEMMTLAERILKHAQSRIQKLLSAAERPKREPRN
jgi:O-antigen/teichoic acid export membrane protein